MVRSEPSLEVLRHELRQHVCRDCRWRPAGSETLGPDVPRSCEPACTVFRGLPALARAARLMDPMLRPPRLTLQHRIRDLCEQRDPFARAGPGHCPLRLYGRQVAMVLARTIQR
jgi:hypothetical protein